jgi:hypothetical protein
MATFSPTNKWQESFFLEHNIYLFSHFFLVLIENLHVCKKFHCYVMIWCWKIVMNLPN